jgi:hypothetical protein
MHSDYKASFWNDNSTYFVDEMLEGKFKSNMLT